MVKTEHTTKRGTEQKQKAITPEEAAQIVRQLAYVNLQGDQDAIGNLLLVIRTLVYEPEMDEREYMLADIEAAVMPLSTDAGDGLNRWLARRLDELRGRKQVSVTLKPKV